MPMSRICAGRLVDALVAEADLAAVELAEARDHAQQRGLAAARRPEQREELALRDRQVDMIDRLDRTELPTRVPDDDTAHHLAHFIFPLPPPLAGRAIAFSYFRRPERSRGTSFRRPSHNREFRRLKVAPIGISEVYERDLLAATSVLQLFLSRDGVRRSFVRFDIDQSIDAVLGGVDDLAVAMLCEASRQIGRYTDIQGSACMARQNVDDGLSHSAPRKEVPRLRFAKARGYPARLGTTGNSIRGSPTLAGEVAA